MSINLISRRFCSSLRLAPQRVVAPRSISSTKTIATPITTQPSVLLQLSTTQSYNKSNNNINNSAVQQRRSFSISTTLQPNNDDDGGPIPASIANFDNLSNKALKDMTTIPGWNLVHNPPRRNPRGALVGKVVSDKMQKTVNVAVDRYKLIPKYRKRWRYTKVSRELILMDCDGCQCKAACCRMSCSCVYKFLYTN